MSSGPEARDLPPQAGFEPTTFRLAARCCTRTQRCHGAGNSENRCPPVHTLPLAPPSECPAAMLRRSREVTQVCARKMTHQNAPFGARQVRGLDAKESPATGSRVGYKDLAGSARMKPPVSSLARGQGLFFAWVTLSEHKWVTSRERRSSNERKRRGARLPLRLSPSKFREVFARSCRWRGEKGGQFVTSVGYSAT